MKKKTHQKQQSANNKIAIAQHFTHTTHTHTLTHRNRYSRRTTIENNNKNKNVSESKEVFLNSGWNGFDFVGLIFCWHVFNGLAVCECVNEEGKKKLTNKRQTHTQNKCKIIY